MKSGVVPSCDDLSDRSDLLEKAADVAENENEVQWVAGVGAWNVSSFVTALPSALDFEHVRNALQLTLAQV